MEPTLSVAIKSMRYPNSVGGDLIEGLSFEVPRQGFVSLLGPTGAGKTTLLRLIAGLERRFDGEVFLDGKLVTGPSRAIQMVFQDLRLLPWKTVLQNIEFASRNPRDPKEIEQVEKWIRIVGLEERRHAWPKTLSGGEEARVAFARAFVDQPRLLLLDEPLRGLDIVTRYALQDELLGALDACKTTVLMVSHSVEDALFLSDTVHIVSTGPMKIENTFQVNVDKPRRRGCRALNDVEGEIIRYMSKQRGS